MLLTLDGITQPIAEWALDYGVPVKLIEARLDNGWTVERAITEPMFARPGDRLPPNALRRVNNATTYAHAGLELTIREWADRLGVTVQAMNARLKRTKGADAFRPRRVRRKRSRGGGGSNTSAFA